MSQSTPGMPDSKTCLLDRHLPGWACILLLILCALVPTSYVAVQYEKRHDLTQMIFFGQLFQSRALPEIRRLNPEINSPTGYDGQFYAQMALDPFLCRPDIGQAMDGAGFRCQRFLLPLLAHILGHGSPAAILRSYALLNLAFWFLLFTALIWQLRPANLRSHLVIYAIMLNTGTLISIQRSLTDLPATTLGFLSLGLADLPAALLISLAILTKPTSGLFLLRYLLPFPREIHGLIKKTGLILLALILPVLWQLHLFDLFGMKVTSGGNFDFPFVQWASRAVTCWQSLAHMHFDFNYLEITNWEWNLFEFLALLSMAFQGVWILLHPRLSHPVWILGAGFAVLFFCLGEATYAEQISYARTILPLTLCFNLLLLEKKTFPLFLPFFIAGNIGLLVTLHDMVGFVIKQIP